MKPNKKKLTKRTIDSIKASEKDVIVWDSEITGYGLRIKAYTCLLAVLEFSALPTELYSK